MADPNLGQIVTASWEAIVKPNPEDNIFEDYWLLYKLKQGQGLKTIDGGRLIEAHLEYATNTSVHAVPSVAVKRDMRTPKRPLRTWLDDGTGSYDRSRWPTCCRSHSMARAYCRNRCSLSRNSGVCSSRRPSRTGMGIMWCSISWNTTYSTK